MYNAVKIINHVSFGYFDPLQNEYGPLGMTPVRYLVAAEAHMSEKGIKDQRMQRMSIEDTKSEKNLRFRFLRFVMCVE